MSNQYMKYHKVAPIEMLKAYSKGELSVSDSMWIEQLMQKNPMVKAVAEDVASINVETVKSISNRTSKSISTVYLSKIGFWSKYGVWIGLSSIALIIGLALFLQKSNTAVYEPIPMSQKLKSSKKIPSNNSFIGVAPVTDQDETSEDDLTIETDLKADNANTKQSVQSPEDEKIDFGNISSDQLTVKTQTFDPKAKTIEPISIDANKGADNTRSFSSSTKSTASQSVVLSVQNVQILAKSNPKDIKRSNNNSGSPLNTFGGNKSKGSSYAIADVPKYRGGDRALQDYFVGKLRPLKITKGEDRFDRSVMIDLEINSRGKLKDYTIHGNLHPIHQKALIEAIKNLPKFSKGSESVVYSIGISF